MSQSMTPESLFLKFRERHDTAALGAVFDLVADDLFAVALHLCRDHKDAEDLLQGTFLLAIERAGRYESGRPLKAWLFGILLREAKALRRRRRRRADPKRVSGPSASQPLDEVLSAETLSSVTQAIATVPQPYRGVLELHLLEALPQGEIAQRLRRSPGTVRTQLWRGLGRLRRILPRGIALGLAASLSAGTGLAAVRQRVLRSAATPTALGAAGSGALFFSGVFLMSKYVLTAAALVVAFSAWALWPDSPPVPADPVSAAGGSTTVVGTAPAQPSTRGEQRHRLGPQARSRTSDLDDSEAPAPARERRTRIQVVDRQANPVPDAEVLIRTREERKHSGTRETETRRRTDTEGRIELRSTQDVFVHAQKEGLGRTVQIRISESTDRKGEEIRLILRPPVRVRGLVLGLDAQPAAGAEIHCSVNQGYPRLFEICAPPPVFSDRDGRFEFDLIERTEYRFIAKHDGANSGRVTVDLQRQTDLKGPVEVQLRFPGAYSVRGVLLDADGKPCKGQIMLLSEETAHATHARRRRTAAEGTFKFLLTAPGRYHLVGGVEGQTADDRIVELSAAQSHREVEMRTTLFVPIRGKAVDEAGKPRAGLRVSAYPSQKRDPVQGCRNSVQGGISGTDTDASGQFRIMLPRGQACALRYHASKYITVSATDVVPPAEDLILKVSREASQGFELAGRVFSAADGSPIRRFRAFLITETSPGSFSDGNVGEGTDGSFELGPFPLGRRYWLRIEAADFAPKRIGPFDATRRRETEDLHLSRTATLDCTVLRPDGRPAYKARVSLVRAGPRDPFARHHQRWTDKAGQVELHSIAPGRYTVHAQSQAEAGGSARREWECADGQRARIVLQLQR